MKMLAKTPATRHIVFAWLSAAVLMPLLGYLRVGTGAEFAFANLVLLPVFLVAWAGGRNHGLFASLFAALTWLIADLLADYNFRESWIPYVNGLARLASYAFVALLTAKLRFMMQHQVEQATHDFLTGLLNRRAFMQAGELEARRMSRYHHPCAVIYLDLDDFKAVNDCSGHECGDEALKRVAGALHECLRETDLAARLGGDEFALLLPELDEAAVQEVAAKLGGLLKNALQDFPPAAASIGVAWFAPGEWRFSAMLKAADGLMYEVKDSGKGRLKVASFAAPEAAERASGA